MEEKAGAVFPLSASSADRGAPGVETGAQVAVDSPPAAGSVLALALLVVRELRAAFVEAVIPVLVLFFVLRFVSPPPFSS